MGEVICRTADEYELHGGDVADVITWAEPQSAGEIGFVMRFEVESRA